MKFMKLPNRRRIAVISNFSALDLYKEIYEDEPYLREGLSIHPKDVVIDIGGNIGLWSLFILEQVPDIRLITVEPVPQIFEALQENLKNYQPPKSSVTLLNIGLAETEKKAEFNFYPRVASDSTATPFDMDQQVKYFLAMSRKGITRILPSGIKAWFIRQILRWYYSPQKVECQLKTLSQVIEELQLDHIDFVKLDAENAEREVIAGIAEKDWPKIRQISMEVHTNIPGGKSLVDDLTKLLQSKGFSVAVDLHSRFSGVGVHMMYAQRLSK